MDYIVVNANTVIANLESDFIKCGQPQSVDCETIKTFEKECEFKQTFFSTSKIHFWSDLEFSLYENLSEKNVGHILRVLYNTRFSRGLCAVFAFDDKFVFIYTKPKKFPFFPFCKSITKIIVYTG